MKDNLFEQIANYVEDEAKLEAVSDHSFNIISPYSNYPVEPFQSLVEDKISISVELVDKGEFVDSQGYKRYYYQFEV